MSNAVASRQETAIDGNYVRSKIFEFENKLAKMPGAFFGDSDQMPLKHSFADGVYVREIFIPKGSVLTGKIHKHSHPNFLMKGEVVVVTEGGGREHLKAPLSIISEPGTKRAVYALEDTVWITVHVTNDTDLEKIEEHVIAKDYSDPVLVANMIERRNCLVLALKAKGRDYKFLLSLKPEGTLLPFKEAIDKAKAAGVSLEGLFASKTKGGEWHVTADIGETPLSEIIPTDTDKVGSWVATGATVATGVGSYFGSKGNKSKSASQGPLETPEQGMARRLLLQYATNGKIGGITAGQDLQLGQQDYDLSNLERTGTGQLMARLNSGQPEMYGLANQGIRDLMDTSTAGLDAQFSPYKALAAREGQEASDAFKRNAAFTGGLYSTDTVRGLGDISVRTAETNQARLADLMGGALSRKAQAVGLAQNAGSLEEDMARGRIGDAFAYGGLERTLQNQKVEAANAEKLRRRSEIMGQLDAAGAVAGQSSQFGVGSVNVPKPNPYMDFLSLVVNAGSRFAGSRGGNNSGGNNSGGTYFGPSAGETYYQ
jgi:quercetin dioxygenase-like cupin family protein